MTSQAVENRIWSRVILEELTRLGVKHVCIAPGSRSTPLALEAQLQTKLTMHTHFDERGLGFLALGLAKASKQPVAVIVTSGTAVANLLPAVCEAKLTGEKLVLLTADRPEQLVDCGANQAIDQRGIFSGHVAKTLLLPSPSSSIALSWLLTSIDHTLFGQYGAVHINCPFPEPLYSDESIVIPLDDNKIERWASSTRAYCAQMMGHDSAMHLNLAQYQKGVLVIGSVDLSTANLAKALAEKMGWLCLCDPQSGASTSLAHYDLWLQVGSLREKLSCADVIVQIGSRIVSKRLLAWIETQVTGSCDYYFVSREAARNNLNHLMQLHIVSDEIRWLESQLDSVNETFPVSDWSDVLLPTPVEIKPCLASQGELNEVGVCQWLSSLHHDYDLFIGNSLIVRAVDMFSALSDIEVFTNRGASGIDGLIATASGVSRARQRSQLVLIGDTSLLYDLNSLALYSQQHLPSVIVVFNNDGGAIFDLLPVPVAQRDSLYRMPHGYKFEHAAQQFGLSYHAPTSFEAFTEQVETHLEKGRGALLIEVTTQAESVKSAIAQTLEALRERYEQ